MEERMMESMVGCVIEYVKRENDYSARVPWFDIYDQVHSGLNDREIDQAMHVSIARITRRSNACITSC